MRWIAFFTDTPDMMNIRVERKDRHLEYLQKHASEIVIAGGCREIPGGVFVGGLWVMEVETKARAIELIENDPYFVPTCRSYQLLVWGKAFVDQSVVL